MAQDTNLNTLIINKMTKAQYNAAEKSDNELYMVTDETYYTADEVDQKLQNVSVDLTGYAKETYVDQKVADLVGSSPDTLNTLNELASALGNDPNFATTITNQLAQKAVKSYVDGNVVANPTLTGSETSLTSIGIGGTNFSVGGSSAGGYDFSNITPIVGTWDATNLWYSTSQINFEVTKKYSSWNEGTRQPYDLTEYIANGAKALYVGCARFSNSSSSDTKYSKDVGTPDKYSADNKHTTYGWKIIPLNIPFTTTELVAIYKSSQGSALSFLQAEYNPSTKKITMYVNGYNSESGSGTTSWYAHYFILAIY